jgi:hypothetical protein
LVNSVDDSFLSVSSSCHAFPPNVRY